MEPSQTPTTAEQEQWAKLDSMIAEQETAAAPAPKGTQTTQAATPTPPSGGATNKDGQAADRSAAGDNKEGANVPAPGGAATAPKGAEGKDGQQQQQQQPPAGGDKEQQQQQPGSKFAKDQQRRNDSWKALNEEKTALASERQKFQEELNRERAALQAQRAEFQREQDAAAAQNSPQAYNDFAVSEGSKAEKLEKAAKAAEDAGDFDKAEKLNKQALTAREFERMAKQKADDLRRNPPPDANAKNAQFQQYQKEWTLKAATDFPDFGKSQSPTQQEAVSFMKQVAQRWPEAVKLPGLVYFAAERAVLKIAADRATALEKERTELSKKVEELTKRVTELDALTNPTPDGGAQHLPGEKSFDQKSPEEQYAELRSMAANL